MAKSNTTRLPVPFKIDGSKDEIAQIEKAVKRAAKSRTGLEVLKEACKHGYSLNLNPPGGSSSCNSSNKIVALSPKLSEDELVFGLIHECRHAGQYSKGFDKLNDIRGNTVKTQTMIGRAMEADAQSMTCLATHELAEKGDKSVKKAFSKSFGYISEPFDKAIEADAKRQNKAVMAAFEGWYDDHDVKTAYENSNHVYPAMFGNPEEFTFKNTTAPATVVEKLCKNGVHSYFEGAPEKLEKGKFIDLSYGTKESLDDLMAKRKEMGFSVDNSYKSMDTRKNVDTKPKTGKGTRDDLPKSLKDFLDDVDKQTGSTQTATSHVTSNIVKQTIAARMQNA